MAALLLCWVLTVAWIFFCKIKKIQAQSGTTANVKCEKCGMEYDVSAKESVRGGFTKQYTVTKTQVKGLILDNSPSYRYFAKKFHCPGCNQKRYAQVLNHGQIMQQNRSVILKEGIKWLAVMAAGGLVIFLLTGIGMSITQKQAEQRAEQEREEYFEERYGDLLD